MSDMEDYTVKHSSCLHLKNEMEVKSVQRFMALGIFNTYTNEASLQANNHSTTLYIEMNDFASYMQHIMNNII